MNIFEEIRRDHVEQREVAAQLIETHGESEERQELFQRLAALLSVHARVEEQVFYVALIADDLTVDKARHSVAEHHELDELVEKLENTDMTSPGWLVTAKTLREKLLHHLDEEEHEIFQMAGKVLTDNQKTRLATSYRSDMNDALD